MKNNNNLREYSLQQLQNLMESIKEKPFRAKQLYLHLWKKHNFQYNKMTDLPKSLQNYLQKNFSIPTLKIITEQISADNTIKILFKLPDNNFVEGVIIPTEKRMTACISVQVGCSLNCKFCATGKLKLKRNLLFWEIYDQVRLLNKISNKYFNKSITNIVVMGMGEPLLNFNNTLKAMEKITDKNLFFQFSPKRITISTAGITKKIKHLAEQKLKYKLAISLHATTDEVRSKIMPINKVNNLSQLQDALIYYYKIVKIPVTYEYVLLKGVNDSYKDIKRLVKISRWIPSKVNIIEYNEVEGSGLEKSPNIDKFAKELHKHGVRVTVRRSRGKDIDAACGQLALKSKLTTFNNLFIK